MAGRTRKQVPELSLSLLPCESVSLKEKPPTTRPVAQQQGFLFTERHSVTGGTLELTFNWRTRLYQRLKLGDKILAVAYIDRVTMMPMLERLGCVPVGWRRMYVEDCTEAESP